MNYMSHNIGMIGIDWCELGLNSTDFVNCSAAEERIKNQIVHFCLDKRLLEIENIKNQIQKDKLSLDKNKVHLLYDILISLD